MGLEDRAATRHIAELRAVTKTFGNVVAAKDLNLTIGEGEFLSFLGPSGCGKTTALRMLAGFEKPTEGEVLLDGQVVNDLDAHHRPVNMVFQQYALFPHLSVFDNIAYGLRQRRPRIDRSTISTKVEQALETVRLGDFGPRRIWEMSGGQQQRVALARAIVNEPKLLLLDEPMAALDRKLRKEMQFELQNLQRQLGITFVLVTHDQEEALSMSDRICVMEGGRIVQVGSPRDLYDAPRSRYVAGFVGTSNFFDATVADTAGNSVTLTLKGGPTLQGTSDTLFSPGQEVCVSIRPEQIALTRAAPATGSAFPVAIRNRIFLGEHTEYLAHSDALGDILVLVPRQAELNEGTFNAGEQAFVSWNDTAQLVLEK
ncbi:ABC transporter ATP-binding protein [Oceanomicrobium pacificus]|uniref:Spermidine/putrescine import ATP-binding protein PotA n=1 Tax=Oceanomicrobium pacificus TaxID=2692916 RepID=A0A6B0TT26_9RHOB|nr:ABC transporter ATP-binding protein [Oceanomicrobium pacificus]MXU64414.1 polyamine ABC transporter ATP-binding protein [Oceanomicrobium pacificus]